MKLERIEPAVNERKPRVCAYARVSTGHEKQENSLENQIEAYTALIKNNSAYEFAGVYADLGHSGTTDRRPEFQRMIKDARDGKIDLIITKSISRFARNTVYLLKYVRELKELGVAVCFEENGIRTDSSDGELMLTVLASFAQEESRSMRENYAWTMKEKFERGETIINTKRFMGFDKDDNGNLVINEEEAKTVRRIFDLYLSGIGTHRIAKMLNEEGCKTVTGALWNPSTIGGMIKNEKYKGDCLLQKTFAPEIGYSRVTNKGEKEQYYVKESHEAIVSEEEWEAAQQIMEYNSKIRKNRDNTEKFQSRYPNSHKLICPYCGQFLRRRHVYGGKIEWDCSTYVSKGKQACKGIRVRDKALNGRIFTEPTVVEEVFENGEKHYRYTGKAEYDSGIRGDASTEETRSSVLPRVNRFRRTVIKL